MSTYIKEFNKGDLQNMINQLKGVQNIYTKEEEMAASAGFIFTWFGAIGGPAVVCATAAVITSLVAWRYDSIQDAIQKTINNAEYYKDVLQNSSYKDMIRMKVYTDSVRRDGVSYIYPNDLKVIGVRVNGSWVEIN